MSQGSRSRSLVRSGACLSPSPPRCKIPTPSLERRFHFLPSQVFPDRVQQEERVWVGDEFKDPVDGMRVALLVQTVEKGGYLFGHGHLNESIGIIRKRKCQGVLWLEYLRLYRQRSRDRRRRAMSESEPAKTRRPANPD